jgi:hypothetical protein
VTLTTFRQEERTFIMKNLLIGTATLALTLTAVPASAQILRGGGMIGGGMGGALGGQIGSPGGITSLPRIDRTIDTSGQGTLSTQGDHHIDTKNGKVSANRSVDASTGTSLTSAASNMAAPSTTASGSAQASGSGGVNAQLVGTNAVRSTASQATGAARSRLATTRDQALTTVGNTRDQATNTVGTVRDKAGTLRNRTGTLANNATSSATGALNGVSTTASGSGNAAASNGMSNLALAGSGAANSRGMFAVTPGMPVTDARGKVIGTVQSVGTTTRGRVQQLRMKVGDKIATLPASNFAGTGNTLVSTLGKADLKKAAKAQAAASANGQAAASN